MFRLMTVNLSSRKIKPDFKNFGESIMKKLFERFYSVNALLVVASAIVICNSTTTIFAQKKSGVQIDFKEYKLKNGLRVILSEDHSAPVISLNVSYDVGARNEKPGRGGFAHLFEHMMFKGSENVGAGEHFYQVFSAGGYLNGFTFYDVTHYFDVLPANQLEMALFLEADRMKSLVINEKNLKNQIDAVKEERRERVFNQPYGSSDVKQIELVYDDYPYGHLLHGSEAQLEAASVKDVADFFKTYYAPNNAYLILVGDFKTNEAFPLIKKYFEKIPASSIAPPKVEMKEPFNKGEQRAAIEDPLARLARVSVGFKAPAGNTADFYAMTAVSSILGGGQSSRLFQTLVKEKQLATTVFTNLEERRGPSFFKITAILRPGVKPELLESAIYEEIEKMTGQAVADWELEKAKNSEKTTFLNFIGRVQHRSLFLGHYAVFYNEPNLVNTRLEKINRVTAKDVQLAARKYLGKDNRVVITTVPKRDEKSTV